MAYAKILVVVVLLSTLFHSKASDVVANVPSTATCEIDVNTLKVIKTRGYSVMHVFDSTGRFLGALIAAPDEERVDLPSSAILGSSIQGARCAIDTSSSMKDSALGDSSCTDSHDVHADNGLLPRLISVFVTRYGLFLTARAEVVHIFPGDDVPMSAAIAYAVDGKPSSIAITDSARGPVSMFVPGNGGGEHSIVLQSINFASGKLQVENERRYCYDLPRLVK